MITGRKHGGMGRKVDCPDIDIEWLGKLLGFLDNFTFGWLSSGERADV